MKPVVIIAIAFVLLVPGITFAEDGYFQNDFGKQVSQTPNVCIFQPNDSRVDDNRWKIWYSDAKRGIDTWRSILGQSSTGNWDIKVIEVPLDKAHLLNKNTCDITVEFVDRPYIENGKYASALGWWEIGTGITKIVYSSFEFCGKEYNYEFDIMVHTYCFSDNFERSKQMANTVQHEFGHALGLGHYRGYDSSFTQSWYDNGLGAPSIMAFIEPNEELRQITQIDVERIHQIYGSQGFGKRTDFSPIFNEPIIPKAIVPVSDNVDIHLSEGETQTYSISGSVPDKLYKRGTYLEIITQKPDGTTEHKAVSVSKTLKKYKHNISFSYSDPPGQYKISLEFDGTVFDKKEIKFSKDGTKNTSSATSKPKSQSSSQNLNPSLYVIDKDGKKSKQITIKSNEKFTIEGYIYKNNVPQKHTSYKILDNVGNVKDGKTNNDGFFRHVLTSEHSEHQKFGQSSTTIVKVCILSNCESAKVFVRDENESKSFEKVPDWIKNNAKWWGEGHIEDSEFTGGIQHLMKEKIIDIPDLPKQTSSVAKEKIPDWIKNNAKWWADGMISEDDFVKGITYLVESGIIKVD